MSKPLNTSSFVPFFDDDSVLSIGGLTIQNGVDSISIFGELTIPNDINAKAQLDALIVALTATRDAMSGADFVLSSPLVNAPTLKRNPLS